MSVHQIKRELIAWTVVYDLCVESLNPVAGHAKTVLNSGGGGGKAIEIKLLERTNVCVFALFGQMQIATRWWLVLCVYRYIAKEILYIHWNRYRELVG